MVTFDFINSQKYIGVIKLSVGFTIRDCKCTFPYRFLIS